MVRLCLNASGVAFCVIRLNHLKISDVSKVENALNVGSHGSCDRPHVTCVTTF